MHGQGVARRHRGALKAPQVCQARWEDWDRGQGQAARHVGAGDHAGAGACAGAGAVVIIEVAESSGDFDSPTKSAES